MIVKKSAQEIEKMAASGAILAATLDLMEANIRPGVHTADLDRIAERFIRAQGATPSFKGFRGFPGSICTSPNSLVVHGIPGPFRLSKGDIISVDVGVTLDGWVSDAARTFAVGAIDQVAENIVSATERALYAGVDAAQPGNRVGDISHAVQEVCERAGLGVIRQLVGHGVGREMHEDPQVPNLGSPGKGLLLEEGMVIAIEPMTSAGRANVRAGQDGWAIFTQDRSLAAHFEHTVAITVSGPLILTPWHLPASERESAAAPRGLPTSPDAAAARRDPTGELSAT
ncbi:MAG: type I methionyl aminopeptidase [Solirubrobacteraceae bacterium]